MLHINLTLVSYVIFGVVAYYACLFVLSSHRKAPPQFSPSSADEAPLMVIVVPAHNEELVLDHTIGCLSSLRYVGPYRVLVLNDASSDLTSDIAHRRAAADTRLRVIDRSSAQGARGKSDVLNHAYRSVSEWCAAEDPWLCGRKADDIVIGIVDADGKLAPDCLDVVSPYFNDREVGTVQIGVRIGNATAGVLTRMQDMEFVGFSWLVQIARDHLGSSGLGGNGQFTRLTALATLGPTPWAPDALTEDLDLGLRLVALNWSTRFCHLTYVEQQGLDHWRPLLRQRTRWTQGHYQCWRHIPALLRSGRARLISRLDLVLYLFLVLSVVVVSGALLANVLDYLHLIDVTNNFFDFVPAGPWYRACSLVLSVIPVTAFMWTYQRHSEQPYRWYEVPAYAVLFTLYTYVWVFTTVRAWARMMLRRTNWVKTPRVVTGEHLVLSRPPRLDNEAVR